MERSLLNGFLAAALFTTSACVIVGNSDGNGGSAEGGDGTGNSGNNGGAGEGGGTGGTINGTGGAPAECTNLGQCPEPVSECDGAVCEDGFCGFVPLPQGQICSAGICDGLGECVECVSNADCNAPEVCNQGVCQSDILDGPCGNNLCQVLPATNACITCFQSEISAGGECQAEWNVCAADGTSSSCTTCQEFFGGEGQNFCSNSAAKVQALLNCICTVGVCAE